MESITRKGFLSAAALGVAAVAAGTTAAWADEEVEEAAEAEAEAEEESETEDEWADELPGRMNITLDELNDMRSEAIDYQEDYVCEDGTVVPAVYVKLRHLVDAYGLGIGSAHSDEAFNYFMRYWTEDEAQAFIEMPRGVAFTAAEWAEKSGRDEEECAELLYDFSLRGMLMRWSRGGVYYYHQTAFLHGLYEYGLLLSQAQDENYPEFAELDTAGEWAELYQTKDLPLTQERAELRAMVFTDDYAPFTSETPFYYVVPVNEDALVEGEEILPLDNWKKIIERNSVIGVSSCQCRLRRVVVGELDEDCPHPMETCMCFGEEAEYYIENGIARQIDQEEATEILQRSVDLGMVIQVAHSKASEVICSCHGTCCDILAGFVSCGPDICSMLNVMPNQSHYNLVVDAEACIGCGACAEQCPMFAITMTDGVPVVSSLCVRCGQCTTVCPVEARKLTLNEDYLELPQLMLDDYNLKASYRFRHGIAHA